MILNPFPLLVKEQKKLEFGQEKPTESFMWQGLKKRFMSFMLSVKKTQKTSKKEIELGQKRYQQMIQFRQQLQEE